VKLFCLVCPLPASITFLLLEWGLSFRVSSLFKDEDLQSALGVLIFANAFRQLDIQLFSLVCDLIFFCSEIVQGFLLRLLDGGNNVCDCAIIGSLLISNRFGISIAFFILNGGYLLLNRSDICTASSTFSNLVLLPSILQLNLKCNLKQINMHGLVWLR
jgi:hypothetical protein